MTTQLTDFTDRDTARTMWEWINQNSTGLNLILGLLTAFIWIAYFQLLYLSFKRQRRTRILINRGAGRGVESRCLVSNMGAEPLYVMSIFATLKKDDQEITADITDLDSREVGEISETLEGTSQGPLMSGEYQDLGRFSSLMARCARARGYSDEKVEDRFDRLELLVIAAYGADDLSVGAERAFILQGDGTKPTLEPVSISTTQLRSKSARRRLERYLADY